MKLVGAWDPVTFAWMVVKLRLRYLERMPLGMPHPEIVDRVPRLTWWPDLARQCHLIVDGTGVGRRVIITGGDAEGREKGYYRVPKKDLISGLQVLLQRGGLQIASKMELAPVLEQELAGRADEDHRERPGAVWGVTGGAARRPGAGGGSGMLGCTEDVCESSGGGGRVLDKPGSPLRRGGRGEHFERDADQ